MPVASLNASSSLNYNIAVCREKEDNLGFDEKCSKNNFSIFNKIFLIFKKKRWKSSNRNWSLMKIIFLDLKKN